MFDRWKTAIAATSNDWVCVCVCVSVMRLPTKVQQNQTTKIFVCAQMLNKSSHRVMDGSSRYIDEFGIDLFAYVKWKFPFEV